MRETRAVVIQHTVGQLRVGDCLAQVVGAIHIFGVFQGNGSLDRAGLVDYGQPQAFTSILLYLRPGFIFGFHGYWGTAQCGDQDISMAAGVVREHLGGFGSYRGFRQHPS